MHDAGDSLPASASTAELADTTAGADMWHTHPLRPAGLRAMRVSDGPAGARGTRWFAQSSACVPCGTALGATWSPEVLAAVATVLAAETRRKGADVLLAPTVNLHRHPLAGRNFECMSEDPELTAVLAAAAVRSLQSGGVGACIKHFVANDQETDRHDISSEVPEAALRELYLRPFEVAVAEAGVWSVMSAYNRLGGVHCSQNRWLLTEVLRDEWGFDGVVVSDWWGTHDTAALAAGLDLEMPGPAVHLGGAVAEAVDSGALDAAALTTAVQRLLRLGGRVGALGAPGSAEGPPARADEVSVDDPADREVLRRAAVESMVLLRNDVVDGVAPLLPLRPAATVAVVGPNAARTAVMGGGSASFVPHRRSDVLTALVDRLGDGATILHEPGVPAGGALRPLDRSECRTSSSVGAPEGFVVEHFATADPVGEPLVVETSLTSRLFWMGPAAPGVPEQGGCLRLTTWFTPGHTGLHTFGLVTGATGTVTVDGATVLDNRGDRRPGSAFFGLGSAEDRAAVHLEAGRAVEVVAVTAPLEGLAVGGLQVGHAAPADGDPLGAAVAAASVADVVVAVVGGDDTWETEGMDRSGFDLPEGQPELLRAVCAANPNTVVVVNCGAPVDLSPAEEAPALLMAWYPGQEAGEAVLDVLTGAAEPGGRLPTTFGLRLDDWSSDADFPGGDGVVRYSEGLRVGYRDFDAGHAEPAFCFGHGLGYASTEWEDTVLTTAAVPAAEVIGSAVATAVRLVVRNTSDRDATDVVQCYLSPAAGDAVDPERPPQHLGGFAKVHVPAGGSAELEVPLDGRALRRWVPGRGWWVPTGTWEVRVSRSSRDHVARLALEVV